MPSAKSNRAGQARTVLATHMSAADLRDLEVVLADAEQYLGHAALPALEEITDFDTASAALEQVWHSIQAAMSDDTAGAEHADASALDALADRMVRSERVVRVAGGRARDAALTTVRESLATLGDIDSVDRLITAGAEAVCRLGFDRSVVSRVESNTWLTEQVYLEDDSEWAAEILAAAQANPVSLGSGLPEDEARRRRKPILVTRVQERETVHQALKEASNARSYVCAPIMVGPRLMGFVHGDRYFHRGDVTDFDAEVIGLFAQGFGFALERAMLTEQLQELRANVRQVGAGLQAFAADGQDTVSTLDRQPAVSWQPPPVLQINGATGADADLTRREIDVFQLMAQGETNQRIARRLSISEGTVKSHVKHILRKLSAANRAEAVARWHEARSRG
jgi:DNA-binding CsgD family transcriptional regulator